MPFRFYACVLAGCLAFGTFSAERVEAQSGRESLAGAWVGEYRCNERITAATISLREAGRPNEYIGVFEFYRTRTVRDRRGSFNAKVSLTGNRSVIFLADDWIERPKGYNSFGFQGEFDGTKQTITGFIQSPGCSSITLSRDNIRQASGSLPSSTPLSSPKQVPALADNPKGDARIAAADQPKPPATITAADMIGTWAGITPCKEGHLALQLEILDKAGPREQGKEARLEFFGSINQDKWDGATTGYAELLKSKDGTRQWVRFNALRYERGEPYGYLRFDFEGRIGSDGREMDLSNVLHGPTCSGKRMAKGAGRVDLAALSAAETLAVQKAAPPIPPAWKGSATSRSGDTWTLKDDRRNNKTTLCALLPNDEIQDCLSVADHSKYETYSMGTGPSVTDYCNKALQFPDKINVRSCILAKERLDISGGPDKYTSFKATLLKIGSCQGLLDHLYKLNPNNFLRVSGKLASPADRLCDVYAGLLNDRGVETPWMACGRGGDQFDQVANCTGAVPTSEAFKKAWRDALAQCQSGEALSIVATLRASAARRSATISPEIGCSTVSAVSVKFGLITEAEGKKIVRMDEDLRGKRPPRGDEVTSAFLEKLGMALGCNAQLRRNCQATRPRSREEEAAQAAMDKVIERAFAAMQSAGISRNGSYSVGVRAAVYAGLREITLNHCQSIGGGKFSCNYNADIDCRAFSGSTYAGIDLPTRLADYACPRLVGEKERISTFAWDGRRYVMEDLAIR